MRREVLRAVTEYTLLVNKTRIQRLDLLELAFMDRSSQWRAVGKEGGEAV